MLRLRKYAENTFFHVFMLALAFVFLIPILWILSTSLKTDLNLFNSKQIIPSPATLKHYIQFFKYVPDAFPITLNTATVAVMSTLGVLLSSSLAGYALARMKFPGRNIIFFVLLGTMMIPGQVTLIPVYVLFRKLDLVNRLQALYIPAFFGSAFSTFFFRQYFMSIPKELEEAAFIDGASWFTTFRKVIVPISKAPYISLGVLNFVGAWNSFFLPTIYLQNRKVWVLTQAIRSLIGRDNSAWGEIIAGVVLVSLPIVIIYFVAQKYITEGISFTGIKG